MAEVNLKEGFPSTNRRVEKGWKTEQNKIIARQYGKEFFDGDRINGYGGYYYDGRWKIAAQRLQKLYGIAEESAVLDVGCAKGFLLFDLQETFPGIRVAGIDISSYAVNKAMDGYSNLLIKQGYKKEEAERLEEKARRTILPHMIIGSAESLPWPDKSFDTVLSLNTIHNLPEQDCIRAIEEMNRVCRNPKNMFIEVDAYRTPEEKERMEWWVLTAKTVKSVEGWLELFEKCKYKGDYNWTIM